MLRVFLEHDSYLKQSLAQLTKGMTAFQGERGRSINLQKLEIQGKSYPSYTCNGN